jgi:hypothetical protein
MVLENNIVVGPFGFNIREGGSLAMYDSRLANNQVSSTLIRGMTGTTIEVYNSTVRIRRNDDEEEELLQGGFLSNTEEEDSYIPQQQNEERKAVVAAMDASTLTLEGVTMELNDNSPSRSLFVPVIVVNHSWADSIDGLCLLTDDDGVATTADITTLMITDETCWWQNAALLAGNNNNNDSQEEDCSSVANNGGGIFVMESDWRNNTACWDGDNNNNAETATSPSLRKALDGASKTPPCPGFCLPLPRDARCMLPLGISAGTSSPLSGLLFFLLAVLPCFAML